MQSIRRGQWGTALSRNNRLALVALIAAAVFVSQIPVSMQGPWTTPPSSSGKARVPSTAADALGVGCSGVSPTAASCTGGLYAGPIKATTLFTVVTTTSTGTQNNFNPGIVGNTIVRCNNASLLTITGFPAGTSGQLLLLQGLNATVALAHNSGSSSAGNKLANIATSGNTPFTAGGSALYVYDATDQGWRLVTHEQGSIIAPAFAAGDYTGQTTMTWTVASGDVGLVGYLLRGRTMTLFFRVSTTTVGGTPTGALILGNGLFGGFTGTGNALANTYTFLNNGVVGNGFARAGSVGVNLFLSLAGTAWAASTDNTYIEGQITFDVT